MDAAAILEAAQAAEEEILVPVARWGGILSADCQRFFTEGYESEFTFLILCNFEIASVLSTGLESFNLLFLLDLHTNSID